MKNMFSYHLSNYFTKYLSAQRNLSINTIQSYRDTFMLFLEFLSEAKEIQPNKVKLTDITYENINSYLDWLESNRNVKKSSRNVRLAAIHSFVKYLQIHDIDHIYEYQKILSIKSKKHHTREIPYLSVKEIKAIINAPDIATINGRRDKVLLTLLYDTGARVDELIHLKCSDIRIDNPATVTLHGKGKKTRVVPIMGNTVKILKDYIDEHNFIQLKNTSMEVLFNNHHKKQFTRAGISYIINKYVEIVNKKEDIQIKIKVHPHTFRHSKAVHLLEAGVELIYIRDILGHSSVKTTEIYAKVCTKNKRDALEKAYIEVTKTELPNWDEDKELISWLQDLCK